MNDTSTLQMDSEPSIEAFAWRVTRMRTSNTMVPTTPKQSRSSLGHVELAHRSIEGFATTVKGVNESECNCSTNAESEITPWFTRATGFTISNYNNENDGKTLYEILQNVPYCGQVAAPSKAVMMFRLQDSNVNTAKFTNNWVKCIWPGQTLGSDERLGAMSVGIVFSESCRDHNENERWDR